MIGVKVFLNGAEVRYPLKFSTKDGWVIFNPVDANGRVVVDMRTKRFKLERKTGTVHASCGA